MGGLHGFGCCGHGGKLSRRPRHTASFPSSHGWSWDVVVRARLTFAVPIVIDLDFGSSEAGISMQLTVVEVGLAIAAAHRPLVRFALLKQTRRTCPRGHLCWDTHYCAHIEPSFEGMPHQQGWPLSNQGIGSLNSDISDPTLSAAGTPSPYSPTRPSWFRVISSIQ